MDVLTKVLFLGVLATAATDIWATFANRVLKFPRTNWAMVGRWLGHIPQGKLIHNPISSSPEVRNELLTGWIFHYCIGITYSGLYFLFVFVVLKEDPTLMSAWAFGLVTILSPWLIMQPGLGLGICAVRAPRPRLVRLQNFFIHSIFGIVLYSGWVGINRVL